MVTRTGGVPTGPLLTRAGRPGRSVATRLDAPGSQAAAEAALGGQRAEAALVAVQPSTGDVLAVADRPVESTHVPRALEGTYVLPDPPSRSCPPPPCCHGLDVGETVDLSADHRRRGPPVQNFEGGASRGPFPFGRDLRGLLRYSAFVSLAPRLAAGDLRRTARDYGLGRKLRLGVPAANGQVPPGRDEVQRAAAMIGRRRDPRQSARDLAGVAAAVADGRSRAPRLLSS